jgi:hypothetical protein
MTPEPRVRLAARQAELVRALYGGPPAAGLDARMVAVTSATLAEKRARGVARAWPALRRELGADFAVNFADYARTTPPPDGGALADGLAFGRVVARQRRLPDDARIEMMRSSSQFKFRQDRLVARRGPYLAVTVVGGPRRIVIVVRLPRAGVRLIALGLLPRLRLTRRMRAQ